jgi:pimeloyl-ACP methyl ester carboxylesterase
MGNSSVVGSDRDTYISDMTPPPARIVRVPVPGGELAVEVHEGATRPVLAIHGVSSTRRLWDWLRVERPALSLMAPDLRGRGDGVTLGGPWGMAQHADDMLAVLDALELDAVDVCGMSMGGFVAIDLAVRHPHRVRTLVLVDGGFPMTAPPGLTREMVPTLFADRVSRLGRKWTPDDYRDFFAGQTATLLDPADDTLRGYLAHDLDAEGLVRLDGDGLIADATDVFFGTSRWRELTVATRLLAAEWSTGVGSPPAYTDDAIAALRRDLPALVDVRRAYGTDHAGSIMTKLGAAATAELLDEAMA